MLKKGFEVEKCDELECMAFNISLDLVLRLFEKNDHLKKITIWSNSEKINYSPDKYEKIVSLLKNRKVTFFNIPENVAYVHAKLYLLKKRAKLSFLQ